MKLARLLNNKGHPPAYLGSGRFLSVYNMGHP